MLYKICNYGLEPLSDDICIPGSDDTIGIH